jgi:unsaturated rhamnogalacturonyl hydrolase
MRPPVFPIISIVLSILFAAPVSNADEFSADSIKNIAKRCARYRLSRGVNNLETTSFYAGEQYNWDIGAYMTGIMALYRLTNEKWVLDSATKWSTNTNWTPSGGINATGDAQCCEQTFCEIYLQSNNTANLNTMAKPTFDNMKQMFDVNRSTGRQRWSWSDALYMSPASITRVYDTYKNVAGSNAARLLDSLDEYWRDCAAYLFNMQYNLWWRDGTVLNAKTSNGSPVFWSGCNAWAIAGLARVLQDLPSDYKDRAYFVQQFKDVCDAIRKAPALGSDGLWRTSLLDYNQYPEKESIASAFFGFAFAWGVNNGLLDRTTYEPYIRKTWSALVANIGSNGMLQWCQTVASGPGDVGQNFSAAEGEGAFCLMAEELTKFLFPTSVNPSTRPQFSIRSHGIKRMSLISRDGKISVTGSSTNAEPVTLYDMMGRIAVSTAGTSGAGVLPVGIYAVKNQSVIANVK